MTRCSASLVASEPAEPGSLASPSRARLPCWDSVLGISWMFLDVFKSWLLQRSPCLRASVPTKSLQRRCGQGLSLSQTLPAHGRPSLPGPWWSGSCWGQSVGTNNTRCVQGFVQDSFVASIFDCQEYEDLQIVKHQAIPLLLHAITSSGVQIQGRSRGSS